MGWGIVGFGCFFGGMAIVGLIAFRRAKARHEIVAREKWRIVIATAIAFAILTFIFGIAFDPNSDEVSIATILTVLLVGLVARHFRWQALEADKRGSN